MSLQCQIDRELIIRGGLREFVRQAWHQIEPGNTFMSNWHLDCIAEHLTAITNGQLKRLVISQPPGTSKSLMCSVFWFAWAWTFKPSTKWIYASYAANISKRDNLRARRLIDSPWYQARWGDVFRPHEDEWHIYKFSNDKAGHRMGTSVGGFVTGEHADIQVVDDPVKPAEVTGFANHDAAAMDKIWDWWSGTMATRLTNANAARVIVMQRLGENDLTGRVLSEGGYEHLMLPMLFEKERRCSTSIGFIDPREKDDELLWPQRFPIETVNQRQKEMGPRSWAAQDQQRPAPAGGALFQRSWLNNLWREFPKGPGTTYIQSWDCTFTGQETSDYTVGQVWAKKDERFYLVDQVRAKMTFTETQASIIALSAKWPQASLKLIEAAANGPGLVDTLKMQVAGIVAEPVNGKGKLFRANAVTPLFEAGNVFLPHPDRAQWVHDFVEELAVFPSGRNDDQVDAMSQALNRLRNSEKSLYLKALGKLS